MGELKLIKFDGTTVTVKSNGSVVTEKKPKCMEQCDGCEKYALDYEGTAFRNDEKEIIIWLCHECSVL